MSGQDPRLQDPTTKALSQVPRSPRSHAKTKIYHPGSPGSLCNNKKNKIQDLQGLTMKQKLMIQDPQNPRSSGSQDSAKFKDPRSTGSHDKMNVQGIRSTGFRNKMSRAMTHKM